MSHAKTPDEIMADRQAARAAQVIPEAVFSVVNGLLAEHLQGHYAAIPVEWIVEKLTTDHAMSRREIFDNRWLDFEDRYRQKGWVVRFEGPDWIDRDVEPCFHFSKPSP